MSDFNIIWIDDESVIFNNRNIQLYKSWGISNIYWGGGTDKLREILKEYGDIVDAVILDVNYPEEAGAEKPDGYDFSGFTTSIDYLRNKYSDLPIFVFSGRPDLLDGATLRSYQKYLACPNIPKGGTQENRAGKEFKTSAKQLLDVVIMKCRENKKYKIREKYHEAFSAAMKLKLHKQFISLVGTIESNEILEHCELINDLRDIVAGVLCQARDTDKILPPLKELNALAYFLQNGYAVDKNNTNRGYLLNNRYTLMNDVLRNSMTFLVNTVQDAKHTELEGPNVQVRNYLSDHSPYLMVSCIYLTIDLLHWYNKVSSNVNSYWNGYKVEELYVEIHDGIPYLCCDSGVVEQTIGRDGDLVLVLSSQDNSDAATMQYFRRKIIVWNLGTWYNGRYRYFDNKGIEQTLEVETVRSEN